jgi:hypothetical protein
MNLKKQESLNFELHRFLNDFSRKQQHAENSNSRNYLIFSIQMGKAC